VNGLVDDKLRALISVPVAATNAGDRTELAVWIDTALNGGLVIPHKYIESLGLVKESSAEAILADGKTVELETYACFFDWFGATYETQIVANDGTYPLLGTMLLSGHKLEIDYDAEVVDVIFGNAEYAIVFHVP
jgi:predicted aspartyl protease